MSKTEAVLFFKARHQKMAKQKLENQLRFGGETVFFDKNATRWLEVWLDSHLNFTAHVNGRMKKARAAELKIKGLSKIYELRPALVRKIQIAAVQSVALYGAELWWKGQKNYQKDLQKLINRQARSITGMHQSTPISSLMSASGLLPAHVLSDFCQRAYAHLILSFPNSIPTENILPISLREGDGHTQPEDLPQCDSIWSTTQRIRSYGQHLARQISVGFCIDPTERVEPILAIPPQDFPGKVCIEDRNRAIQVAREELADLTFWCDWSKLDQGGTGAAVVWKRNRQDCEWQTQKTTLGKNKEIFDAEIWGISEAVKVAERTCLRTQQPLFISIFCDS